MKIVLATLALSLFSIHSSAGRVIPLHLVIEAAKRAPDGYLQYVILVNDRTTHGAFPHRAPSTRCTAESVHRVWHRSTIPSRAQ